MFCKHCGKEIADDAKFCAGCGHAVEIINSQQRPAKEKKKKKRHPILGTIILVIGVFMIIGAIGGSDEPKKVESAGPGSSVVETTEPSVFTVGDTLEFGNILVTLNDVTESTGYQFFKPTDGNVFVTCEFTIENNSDSDIAVSSMMSFECYFDDYSANINLGAMTGDQTKKQLDGTVAPGKKINGIVGYEAAKDWKNMEIRFRSSPYASKPFVFNYSK